MKRNIIQAIRLTIVSALLFPGLYTLIVSGIAQLTPNQGKGEIITQNGKRHYVNIGQKFTEDHYFWSRPSAVDYNAAGAGGSNKGPYNPEYLKTVEERIDSFLEQNPGVALSEIPSELVTASGSGLDPHISVQAANIQISRIAKTRNIAEGNLKQLIISNTENPLTGLFGTERINVLKLNMALDDLK